MEKERINCVFCNGEAVLKHEQIELMDGKIILKEQPYYKCTKCKEDFVTREQMLESEAQIREHFAFTRPVISTGRSLAITLPSDLIKFYHLKKGLNVKIVPENHHTLKIKI